jgi:catechol 2,3-dioxygenase-like lactoylglutathione lyase family enzyme
MRETAPHERGGFGPSAIDALRVRGDGRILSVDARSLPESEAGRSGFMDEIQRENRMSSSTTTQKSREDASRRSFIKRAIAAGAVVSASSALSGRSEAFAQQATGIRSFDHVAFPMQNDVEMISFYQALGLQVRETEGRVSVHFGDQKINFHRSSRWRSETFTLRAPAATPPCGDFCWVWDGDRESLYATLRRAGAEIVTEGERDGGRDGGNVRGQSVYTRDPDGNLLEFIRYS